jgi:hypothetical protein
MDDNFPLTSQFVKPFPGELCKRCPKRIFNYRLGRAQCRVENTFGTLASVFRVFHKPLAVECNTAESIVCTHISAQFLVKKFHVKELIYIHLQAYSM